MIDIDKLTYDEMLKFQGDHTLDASTRNEIITRIQSMKEKISNIEFINRIGFQFNENIHGKVITRSSRGNLADIFAIFFGVFSLPFLTIGITSLIDVIFVSEGTYGRFIGIAFLLLIGGYLFALFLKGVNRRYNYTDFSFEKNNSGYVLRRKYNLENRIKEFSSDSEIIVEQTVDKVNVIVSENNSTINLFTLSKLNTIQEETLYALVEKLKFE